MTLLYDLRTYRYKLFKAANFAKVIVEGIPIRLSEANDFCRPLSGRFSGQQVERLVMHAGAAPLRFLTTGEVPAVLFGLVLSENGVLILDGYEDIVNLIVVWGSPAAATIQVQYFYPM